MDTKPDEEMGMSRHFSIDAFRRTKLSPSSTTEYVKLDSQKKNIFVLPPSPLTLNQHYFEPGAFHVEGTSNTTPNGAYDDDFLSEPTWPPPLDIPEPLEDALEAYLVEANPVSEPDLEVAEPVRMPHFVVGEPIPELLAREPAAEPEPVKEQGFWRQRKVKCLAFIVLLVATTGLGIGFRVRLRNEASGSYTVPPTMTDPPMTDPPMTDPPMTDPPMTDPPIFDCSNTSVGCLYIGSQSLGFQDPASFLVANCIDTEFDFPTSDNCGCEVRVPASTSGNSEESCQSCSFVDDDSAADGEWRIAYDCSNILSGDCVGRDAMDNCISKRGKCFETTDELRDAVDLYLADNSHSSSVASTYGWPIGEWCVSDIQDFSQLFSAIETSTSTRINPAAANFNEDISGWDVSSARAMRSMFAGSGFNQPIGNWDVSSVRDMGYMFSSTLSFDQPLEDWDVSSVTDMAFMFSHAESFDQPLGNWGVSSVRDMSGMFDTAASFDEALADWDVSSVTRMEYMFYRAGRFNQPIGSWDVSSVLRMDSMFYEANSFDQSLVDWNVSSVTTMLEMFVRAYAFNQPLEEWDVSSVRSVAFMFYQAESFDQPIGNWNVSNVRDMSYMFKQAYSFNQVLADWDVSSVTTMSAMFAYAAFVNQPLGDWDVSRVTDMAFMFYQAESFDQPIGNWNVSNVRDMTYMFNAANSFNQQLADWDVSSVTTMPAMFFDATTFNQPLGDWDVSSVTDLADIFTFSGCPVQMGQPSCF